VPWLRQESALYINYLLIDTIRKKLIKLSITSCCQVAIFSVKPERGLYDEYLVPSDQGVAGRRRI
jgi:hypothetical protein